MLRKIIRIDANKCNGCGLCAEACHEGAIGMSQGKAVLLRDDYCDGLGDCLPICPTGAISFEEREALAYDEAAVQENMRQKQSKAPCACPGSQDRQLGKAEAAPKAKAQGQPPLPCGCPGSQSRKFGEAEVAPESRPQQQASALRQWPVQLRLVPAQAAFFNEAELLIAADCAAYAHGNFHADYMRGKITLIACPKLDPFDYSAKLAEIFQSNTVRSVTVIRMSVPCCGGLEQAVKSALRQCKRAIPFNCVTLSPEGEVKHSAT